MYSSMLIHPSTYIVVRVCLCLLYYCVLSWIQLSPFLDSGSGNGDGGSGGRGGLGSDQEEEEVDGLRVYSRDRSKLFSVVRSLLWLIDISG